MQNHIFSEFVFLKYSFPNKAMWWRKQKARKQTSKKANKKEKARKHEYREAKLMSTETYFQRNINFKT